MPKMPPRPCTKPGCKNYSVKNGRCTLHKVEPWLSNKGKSRHDRGYGNDWVRLRKQVLRRDGFLCIPCKKAGTLTKATQVDHILNKAKGGSDDMYNLQSICDKCHKLKTQGESNGR